LTDKDKKILHSVNLSQLFEIVQKEKLSDKEQKIIDIFNSYYVRQKENAQV
jgi:hypothetical protein